MGSQNLTFMAKGVQGGQEGPQVGKAANGWASSLVSHHQDACWTQPALSQLAPGPSWGGGDTPGPQILGWAHNPSTAFCRCLISAQLFPQPRAGTEVDFWPHRNSLPIWCVFPSL